MALLTKKAIKQEPQDSVVLAEMKAMRQIAHRVVDQLTAVSGYSQLALERRAAKMGVCAELNKIRTSAEKAIAMVRLALVHLSHLEGEDAEPLVPIPGRKT